MRRRAIPNFPHLGLSIPWEGISQFRNQISLILLIPVPFPQAQGEVVGVAHEDKAHFHGIAQREASRVCAECSRELHQHSQLPPESTPGSAGWSGAKPHFPFLAPGLSWWDLPESWKRILFLYSVTWREPEFPSLLFPLAMSLLLHETCSHQSQGAQLDRGSLPTPGLCSSPHTSARALVARRKSSPTRFPGNNPKFVISSGLCFCQPGPVAEATPAGGVLRTFRV